MKFHLENGFNIYSKLISFIHVINFTKLTESLTKMKIIVFFIESNAIVLDTKRYKNILVAPNNILLKCSRAIKKEVFYAIGKDESDSNLRKSAYLYIFSHKYTIGRPWRTWPRVDWQPFLIRRLESNFACLPTPFRAFIATWQCHWYYLRRSSWRGTRTKRYLDNVYVAKNIRTH